MKPILGFAALLAWLSHCPDINLHGHGRDHHQGPGQQTTDAGAEATPDAGDDAAVSVEDAALIIEDGAMPPIIEDAGTGSVSDASDVDEPDSSVIEEASKPVIVPAGECDTGKLELYEPGYCDEQHLALGVQRYVPKYPLWSDGAIKDRYIWLPPNSYIDTTNLDRWAFPVGTKMWKLFTSEGTRIETRLLVKTREGTGFASWDAYVYLWSQDQRTATLWDDATAMTGVPNALGKDHDVPSKADCATCHTITIKDEVAQTNISGDAANGFGAIQLNWDPPSEPDRPQPITLRGLRFRGVLRNGIAGLQNVFADESLIPGDAKAQDALGYLHANCGHCHGGETPRASLKLWAPTRTYDVSEMPAFQQACKCLARWFDKPIQDDTTGAVFKYRIQPGDAAMSGIVGRMSYHLANDSARRDPANQMPRIGTEFIDVTGLTHVQNWIDAMDPTACTDVCLAPPPPAMPAATTPPPPMAATPAPATP
jgi:hypothetical protein